MASTDPPKKRGFGWPGAVGIGLSLFLLWWALRDISPAELATHLRAVRIVPLLATAVFATLVFVVRAIRWRYILRLDGETLPFRPLWHATAIGFMANNLLPARTGELARAYAATKMTSVRFSTAAATIVVSRIMDGLAVVALLAVAAAAGGFSSTTTVGSLTLGGIMSAAAAIFGLILAAAVVTVHWPNFILSLTRRISGVILPQRWAAKPVLILEGLLEGLEVLRDWRRFATVAAWSFGVWGVNGLSFWVCFSAFDLDVPWSGALVLQSLIAFGVALAPSPGYFGAFEAVTRVTLALYGIDPSPAVSYAVGYHIITFIPITLLGLWSLSRAHLHFADLRKSQPPERSDQPETGE